MNRSALPVRILGVAAVAAIAGAAWYGLFVVPPDANQGDAQRILYLHVPSAWFAFFSFGVTALASLGWLIWRQPQLDSLALASAEVGVLFTATTIWAGMMWGKPVWGTFWQWEDPRMVTTALLLALYLGYLLVRRLTDDPERRATRAAVVGIIAAIDIPIVHFSVTWWRGLHQGPTFGDPGKILHPSAPEAFVSALLLMLGAVTLAWIWLVVRRYQLARIEWQREDARRRAAVGALVRTEAPA